MRRQLVNNYIKTKKQKRQDDSFEKRMRREEEGQERQEKETREKETREKERQKLNLEFMRNKIEQKQTNAKEAKAELETHRKITYQLQIIFDDITEEDKKDFGNYILEGTSKQTC